MLRGSRGITQLPLHCQRAFLRRHLSHGITTTTTIKTTSTQIIQPCRMASQHHLLSHRKIIATTIQLPLHCRRVSQHHRLSHRKIMTTTTTAQLLQLRRRASQCHRLSRRNIITTTTQLLLHCQRAFPHHHLHRMNIIITITQPHLHFRKASPHHHHHHDRTVTIVQRHQGQRVMTERLLLHCQRAFRRCRRDQRATMVHLPCQRASQRRQGQRVKTVQAVKQVLQRSWQDPRRSSQKVITNSNRI
mmetsp:Transcript_34992/g.52654  ORF Transcript_34992/g.52654 Transcript_34992/m.52654 type:complete len:246 (-) Transcript_34992:739-1476(-)